MTALATFSKVCFHIHFRMVSNLLVIFFPFICGLRVNYLIFNHLENFPGIFLLLFSNWSLLWLKNQFLFYFSILKLIEICFVAYNMACLVECFMCTWKNVFTAVLSGVFYKCQLCRLAKFFFWLHVPSGTVKGMLVLQLYFGFICFSSIVSFCFMYLKFFKFLVDITVLFHVF